MEISTQQKELLRSLPGVDQILESIAKEPGYEDLPRSLLTRSIRRVLDELRGSILASRTSIKAEQLDRAAVLPLIYAEVDRALEPKLKSVVNATGIVIHTNLGRSLLAQEAVENVARISASYSNLEFDLEAGRRGSRYSIVEEILCEVSGAEAGLVVNNNAGAVLLALDTVARGRKVIVSRGELVEIGGSFRIPDVMAKSGGRLCEVGTTNRTHRHDYENAIDSETALLLKVHKSNYSVVGFTKEVSLGELVELGRNHGIPVMEDLGSGTFIDFSRYGMTKEPTVQESVKAGVDIVTFSGDKLLGGPQAGLIVGKKDFIEKIKKNPINRALRIDKMTLAALESTLRLYRDEKQAVAAVPTLQMMTVPMAVLIRKADILRERLAALAPDRLSIEILDLVSRPGGGSLPLLELPTKCLGIRVKGLSCNTIEHEMRRYRPPIIGRIEEDRFIMDVRTIKDTEISIIEKAFANLVGKV
ncbi:MAG TPA: L-seryl-tRNA(Sec) selenium transferase [Desulfobacterales bacterium]